MLLCRLAETGRGPGLGETLSSSVDVWAWNHPRLPRGRSSQQSGIHVWGGRNEQSFM